MAGSADNLGEVNPPADQCVEGEPSASISGMTAGMVGWIEASGTLPAGGGTLAGLEKGGLVVIIIVSVVAIAAFVWIFRGTGRRE